MRGGAGRIAPLPRVYRGRSPHARGSPLGGDDARPHQGSIPACAGEPLGASYLLGAREVDPRMRGGAMQQSLSGRTGEGRSPHARGSRLPPGQQQRLAGSIPACAGEPVRRVLGDAGRWVDPRMRGGAALEVRDSVRSQGRSPHARGSQVSSLGVSARVRSIPACAGEPYPFPPALRATVVDPRMRGGAANGYRLRMVTKGRSPHARGSRRT